MEGVVERLHQFGLTDVVVTTITDLNSTAEQSCVFAHAGIVIAAHSSQLVNMLFSPPSTAIVRHAVGPGAEASRIKAVSPPRSGRHDAMLRDLTSCWCPAPPACPSHPDRAH